MHTTFTQQFQTLLLMNVLREIHFHDNAVQVNGKLAYVPQEPWIISGTLKSNILFGLPYDQNKFSNIMEACALAEVGLLPNVNLCTCSFTYFIHPVVGH